MKKVFWLRLCWQLSGVITVPDDLWVAAGKSMAYSGGFKALGETLFPRSSVKPLGKPFQMPRMLGFLLSGHRDNLPMLFRTFRDCFGHRKNQFCCIVKGLSLFTNAYKWMH